MRLFNRKTATLQPPASPRRRRSSSIKEVYNYVKSVPGQAEHHLLHLRETEPLNDIPTPLPAPDLPRPKKKSKQIEYGPKWLRWVTHPGDSLLLLAAVASLYLGWEVFVPKEGGNPFHAFIFLSHALEKDGEVRYQKGWKDAAFLLFYVVFFSFKRQAVTMYVVKPAGKKLGVTRTAKLERFMEQGYAIVYFGLSSAFGLYVLRTQDSWWYKTEHFWLDYPNHWAMTGPVKAYYLLGAAYWLQQALVMLAGLEKPRDDYVELVLHHCITLYLIATSYVFNLTQIGIAVFLSMDVPDLLLAISKCINYVGLETTGNCSFIIFMFVWGYLRHYQNIRMLWSVYTEFELVPAYARVWSPAEGFYLPPIMQSQIFLPIFLLQLVIAFWSFLILRIVVRMLRGKSASDVREEGETEGEGASETEGKKDTRRRETRKAR